MKLSEIVKNLDALIPKTLSEEWDNDGNMLILDPEREVLKIVVALDVTKKAVEYAKEVGADLIISHHPLIFKPLANLDSTPKTKLLLDLISSGISVLSYHTRFDNVEGGMNDALSDKLEVRSAEPLDTMARIGTLESPLSAEEFASYVSEKLSTDVILYSAQNKISKVALIGGGGKDFVLPARLAGADAIVTGDISHGVVIDEVWSGITVVDAGHFGTEKIFVEVFPEFLKKAGVPSEAVCKFCDTAPGVFVLKES